jgi:hypothetical protein
MPNISEISLSDISLSRACTVMIIFFPLDGKSIEGPEHGRSIQPLNSPDSLRFRRSCGLSPADVCLSIEELSILNRPKSRSGDGRS